MSSMYPHRQPVRCTYTHTALCLLTLLSSVHYIQCVGFHLPPPDSFTHSCTPLGSWAVAGNVTLSEVDSEFYQSNLTFKIDNRSLCSINLETCPELATPMPSTKNSPNVCECVSRFTEDDYKIYIKQEIAASDTGGMLTVIVPGQPKYAPLQVTHDIGHIPSRRNNNNNFTYQINSGLPTQLASTQNISTCRGQPLTITVCAPHSQPGTVLRIRELWQTTSSLADHCIHIMDTFDFDMTDSYPVMFSYDDGTGCAFKENFVFNVQERKDNTCTTAGLQWSRPGVAPNAPCPETPTSPPRQTVTLNNGIQAMCDTWTTGGNWILIQRRTNGDIDFYRGWMEYVAGFGDLDGDHWMGLQDIHSLCPPSRPCNLRVDLKDDHVHKSGVTVWAEYSSFSVGGFTDKYKLSLSGYNSSSTVFDGFSIHHNEIPFSTYDRDNDSGSARSCAVDYHGGWWYNLCHYVNLNGMWGVRGPTGLQWWNANQGTSPLYVTYSEMKVRLHP